MQIVTRMRQPNKDRLNIKVTQPSLGLSVRIKIGGIAIQEYEGAYIITPSGEIQILETNQKKMNDDVTVLAVPYAETANSAGGITVTIGG